MNFDEFFTSERVRLPRGGFEEGNHTYDGFLRKLFDDYIESLKQVDDPNFQSIVQPVRDSIDNLERLSDCIVAAVKEYLDGHPHSAYDAIAASLKLPDIHKLCSTLGGQSPEGLRQLDPVSACMVQPRLYRIRSEKVTPAKQLTRKDIFHVPFEKRRRVNNQRYSIAGLPCLYLGSSIWICWEELRRPALDSLWVSRFQLAKEVQVLDLQFPPDLVWYWFKQFPQGPHGFELASRYALLNRFTPDFMSSYILSWPLIAACSIKVESQDGSFFPQYILPQIILQWVTRTGIVQGIRYFSTQTAFGKFDGLAHSNCVFPARQITSGGQCKALKESFRLTEPISWEFLQACKVRPSDGSGPSNAKAVVSLNSDFRLYYQDTAFFDIEKKLEGIEMGVNCSRFVDD